MKKPYVFLVGEDADLPPALINNFPIKVYLFTVKDGRTSQPSPDVFIKLITEALKSYEQVVVITISSELSGTYNSAVQAVKKIKNYESRIKIIDSGASSGAVGLSVIVTLNRHAELISASKKIPKPVRDDILMMFRENLAKAKLIGTIDNPMYLEKGGRINKIQSVLVQNMIRAGIRPILCIKDKKIAFSKVSRPGSSKVSALVDVFSQEIKTQEKISVAITHADCLTDAEVLKEELLRKFPQVEVVYVHSLAKVLETHLGPGALLLSWL